MSALHQALTKAFAQQNKGAALQREPAAPKTAAAPTAGIAQPAAAASSPEAPEAAEDHREERHFSPDDRPSRRSDARATRLPLKDAFGVELTGLDKALRRTPAEAAFPEPETPAREVATGLSDWRQANAFAETPTAIAESFETLLAGDAQCFPDASWSPPALHPADAAAEAPAREVAAGPSDWRVADAVGETPTAGAATFETPWAGDAIDFPAETPLAGATQAVTGLALPPPAIADRPSRVVARRGRDFRPGWQVDRFSWPRVCRRLIARAAEEWDRLTDALVAARDRGQKVLALAGCQRGEGATTLLLCAARRLAERGVKAVLVDADRLRPRLAKRLGVQPQLGWDETSPAQGKPLDYAVVEATENNLALLSNRPLEEEGLAGDWSRLASSLETLREHYEMVLVDLGPLENNQPIGEKLSRAAGRSIDAVLLVHNGRITPQKDLREAQRSLTQAGINVAGIIQNFVTAEEDGHRCLSEE
jgi:Mrp family chromosome partitioning ATPase